MPIDLDIDCGDLIPNRLVCLGYKKDVFITPLRIKLPIPTGVWENNRDKETHIEVILTREKEDSEEKAPSYLIKPNARDVVLDGKNNLNVVCWIPKEVTAKETTNSNYWKIALHLWTDKEPLFEIYTTIVQGEVKYTFLDNEVVEQEKLEPLYKVEEDTLVLAGEDWLTDNEDYDIDLPKDLEVQDGQIDLGRHQV